MYGINLLAVQARLEERNREMRLRGRKGEIGEGNRGTNCKDKRRQCHSFCR
jgi:hypothetical protein